MGSGRWSTEDYTTYSSSLRGRSTHEVFGERKMKPYLNPYGIGIRESCDSQDNPNSTPIILGLDVTGSMDIIADVMAREGLGTLVEGIIDRRPITDPHIMVMAIGDVACDNAPLQASQFEADIRIAEQLKDLFIEGGGGGNDHESYDLPWYFAAEKTKIDSFTKRGKKGYLVTIGDESIPSGLEKSQIKRVFGRDNERNYSSAELLALAEKQWQVFHVIVEQGSYARRALPRVTAAWRELLGKRAILLSDYNHLSQVILSIIEVAEGDDPEEVIASWENDSVRKTVRHALFD